MTHRRAVVQGLQVDNIRRIDFQSFWVPCMDTVKRWAKRNDWSYHFFDTAIDPYDVSSLLNVDYYTEDAKTRNGQFYKIDWVNSLCDQYDEILWLDSDIYVWGNPQLPAWPEFDNLKCMYTHSIHAWQRPNFSIFWSSSKTLQEMYNWNQLMLNNPSERGEIYSCLLTLARHGCLDNREFTEEVSFIDWTITNASRVDIIPYKTKENPDTGCDWAYNGRYLLECCTPDSFLHLCDYPKQNQLQRFLAYKAYLAYLSTGKQ